MASQDSQRAPDIRPRFIAAWARARAAAANAKCCRRLARCASDAALVEALREIAADYEGEAVRLRRRS